MADNGTVLLTHKHIGTQAVRFYFSLTGVKGLMEGLNKLCFMSLSMNIQTCMGLSSISASWSRSKLKTKNTKPMWDHSHINNDTHRLPHI